MLETKHELMHTLPRVVIELMLQISVRFLLHTTVFGLNPRTGYVEFVVEKVALDQVFP
jgi:hypothetical protein